MRMTSALTLFCLFFALDGFAASIAKETFRNDKVAITEETLQPGASEANPSRMPSMTVFVQQGAIEVKSKKSTPKEGEVLYRASDGGVLKNVGPADLKIVRIDLVGPGDANSTWGTTGLSPNYKLLFENQFVRAYDIKIPAGTDEPQHTHKNRVVVCLSGAQLMHLLPDGTKEPSTLETGVVGWRRGGTHIGRNLGKTDLWVIAVEPK